MPNTKLFVTLLLMLTALIRVEGWLARAEPPVQRKPPRTDLHGDPLPSGAVARLGTMRLRRDYYSSSDFAFTPDGKAIVSARNGKVVQFWDAKTGKPLHELRHEKRFGIFDLSANGKILAAAGVQGVTLWDAAKRKQLRTIGTAKVEVLAISPDGKTLATAAEDRIIRLWDARSGEGKRKLPAHKQGVAILFAPDGKTLISVGGSKIRFWDVASAREVRKFDATANCIAVSSDGVLLASGDRELVEDAFEARLLLWDLATGRKLRQMSSHTHRVDALALSPDGKMLASAERDTIHLWDVATGKEIRRIENSGWRNKRLIFSPDGKTLASTAPGNETVLRLWDTATGKPLHPPGPDGVIRTVAFSPDGRFIATGSWLGNDPHFRLWDASTGKPLWQCELYQVNKVIFTPDGNGVFASGSARALGLWDARTGKQIRDYPIRANATNGLQMALSADGKRLTSVHGLLEPDVRVIVWDALTGKQLVQRTGQHPSFLNILSFSADAEIAAEPKGKVLGLWEAATGQLLLRLEPSNLRRGENLEESVAFSPDGRTVAAITAVTLRGRENRESTLHLWELATGKTIRRISAGENSLEAVAFSPDGRTLAAAGAGVLQLWDVATGKQLLAYRGQESQVELGALAFSPDGKRLVAGYADSTALVWDLTPGIRRVGMPKKDLNRADLDRRWSDLAGEDAARAYTAVWALVAAPDEALRLLKARLKPVQAVDPQRFRRLLTDLDSEEFAVREAATKELEQIGDRADPLLREALAKKPSLEVRRRMEGLLERPRIVRSPESLRRLRAMHVLEQIGTPEAVMLLESQAKGATGARATREAKAALQRLARRGAIAPP